MNQRWLWSSSDTDQVLSYTLLCRRRDLGLTQGDLALRSGISRNRISQIESGQDIGAIKLSTLRNLLVALSLEWEYTITPKKIPNAPIYWEREIVFSASEPPFTIDEYQWRCDPDY